MLNGGNSPTRFYPSLFWTTFKHLTPHTFITSFTHGRPCTLLHSSEYHSNTSSYTVRSSNYVTTHRHFNVFLFPFYQLTTDLNSVFYCIFLRYVEHTTSIDAQNTFFELLYLYDLSLLKMYYVYNSIITMLALCRNGIV